MSSDEKGQFLGKAQNYVDHNQNFSLIFLYGSNLGVRTMLLGSTRFNVNHALGRSK